MELSSTGSFLLVTQYFDFEIDFFSQNFVIQGGDPTGTGKGGVSVHGGPFEDEITVKLKHTGAGVSPLSFLIFFGGKI